MIASSLGKAVCYVIVYMVWDDCVFLYQCCF